MRNGMHPPAATAAQVSAVAWLAIVMNALNRVAITGRYPVGS